MTALSSPRKLVGFIASLFFFSGFAALVYQVVWMRYLSLFFGSDVYAAAITLSVFMGGLSLGSAVAERLVDKLVRPLLCYGLIEIAIGMYAFFFRDLLAAFAPLLEPVYRTQFDAAPLVYQAVRIGVAALVLLVPATLMGSTLPLIVKSFVQRDAELGRFGGTFYAINTLGALAGTLICAFALVPFLGVAHTTLIAVAINLTIGTLVALISCRSRHSRHMRVIPCRMKNRHRRGVTIPLPHGSRCLPLPCRASPPSRSKSSGSASSRFHLAVRSIRSRSCWHRFCLESFTGAARLRA